VGVDKIARFVTQCDSGTSIARNYLARYSCLSVATRVAAGGVRRSAALGLRLVIDRRDAFTFPDWWAPRRGEHGSQRSRSA